MHYCRDVATGPVGLVGLVGSVVPGGPVSTGVLFNICTFTNRLFLTTSRIGQS